VRGEPFQRELDCYERLRDHSVLDIRGHRVPRLLAWDHELWVIEMTTVKRPFLLDFAGAWLDNPPDFADEVVEQWHEEKLHQFGERWPDVQAVLAILQSRYGIYLLDIHPGNLTFGG